jgi:phage tail tube protein FII
MTSTPKIDLREIKKITYNGKDWPFAISVKGNTALEEEFNCPLHEILLKQTSKVAVALLREAVKGGYRLKGEKEQESSVTTETAELMIDAEPALFGDLFHTYGEASSKYYRIQNEGNQVAGNKPATQ